MQQLIDTFTNSGMAEFAAGCYGKVYGKDDFPWIVKFARNDGTRTYLEWCYWKCSIGQRMRGMPHIDFLVDAGERRVYEGCYEKFYIVAMQRYESIRDRLTELFGSCKNYQIHDQVTCPRYIRQLIETFESDTGMDCNDTHSGNFMFDERLDEIILTDPSSRTYRTLGECLEVSVTAANTAQRHLFIEVY